MLAANDRYCRNIPYASDDSIDFGTGPLYLLTQTNYTLMCTFRAVTDTSVQPGMFRQQRAFNQHVSLSFDASGILEFGHRTSAGTFLMNSTVSVRDNRWHDLVCLRRSTSPYLQLWIDGRLHEEETSTDPGTDTGTPSEYTVWGHADVATGRGFGGQLKRCAFVGRALDVEVARRFLQTGEPPGQLDHWLEMIGTNPERDLTGNGDGTITGTTIVPYLPYVAPRYLAPAVAATNVQHNALSMTGLGT